MYASKNSNSGTFEDPINKGIKLVCEVSVCVCVIVFVSVFKELVETTSLESEISRISISQFS